MRREGSRGGAATPAGLLLLLVAGCSSAAPRTPAAPNAPDNPPELRLVEREEVSGVEAQWRSLSGGAPPAGTLRLYTAAAARGTPGSRPAVAGSTHPTSRGVRFEPAFPLLAGEEYVAVWTPEAGSRVVRSLGLPALPVPEAATRVVHISPGGESVPENLLRFYVTFSQSMARGEAARRVRLVGEQGEEVRQPFVALDHELWTPDSRRLTLFVDPGRTKRQVGPNRDHGPVLRQGRRYRLVIDRGWPDARGAPLLAGAEKSFRVGEPDRQVPRSDRWVIRPPLDARGILEVEFDEPLDRAVAERLLTVYSETGDPLAGEARVADGEQRLWTFRPDSAWAPGSYQLQAAAELEDLAGNSLSRPFETALSAPVAVENPVRLDFRFAGEVAHTSR